MSHPVLWPKKTFFYPIGNTAPVSLTQDLPLEEQAVILLLGCGDPRHILHTLYTEETLARRYDLTCCDMEPGILARNVLLLTLIVDGQKSGILWNIFYHLKLDKESLNILAAQSTKLVQYSSTLSEWSSSPYFTIFHFCSQSTLTRLQSYWQKYADAIHLTDMQHKRYSARLRAAFEHLTDQDSYLNYSVGRSAGPFWDSATRALSRTIPWYWKTGIIQRDEKAAQAASFVNPTFVYSLTGDSCAVHYGTYPLQAFHLADAYTSVAEKDVSETHIIDVAMQQFSKWCSSFKTVAASGRCVLRFFAGDAIAFCHALHHLQTTGSVRSSLYLSAWSGTELLLDGQDYSPSASPSSPLPVTFNVIETSNIIAHIGVLNLLIAVTPLLKPHPSTTLYTEALIVEGGKDSQGFLQRLCAELPTISLLLGIIPVACIAGFSSSTNVNEIIMSTILSNDTPQYHERIAWKNTASNVAHTFPPAPVQFAPEQLAKILFGIYYEMFKDLEDVRLTMSALSKSPKNAKMTNIVHYHRITLVMLIALCKSRLQCDWDTMMSRFFDFLEQERRLILNSNYYQEFCAQLYMRGIYTVDVLAPGTYMEFLDLNKGVFSGWKSIPPVVCVVVSVPREKLRVLENIDSEKLGSPMLQCEIKGATSHNVFSASQMIFGKIVLKDGIVTIEEDIAGFQGSSPLVVSAWVPSHALQKLGAQCTIGLGVQATPQASMILTRTLGPYLTVFAAKCMDRKHVQILPYRPDHPNELEDIRISHKPISSATVSANVTSNLRISELTMRWDIIEPSILDILPKAVIDKEQNSPSALALTMDSNHVHRYTFPFPVDGTKARLRIARKSKYIEVIAPIMWPAFKEETTSLEGRASGINTDGLPIPWSVHTVLLDRSPIMHTSVFGEISELSSHFGASFSARERKLREDEASKDVVMQIKDVFNSFFAYASKGYRLFQLDDKLYGGYSVIYVNDIRLDLPNHTFVADACVLPLTVSLLEKDDVSSIVDLVVGKTRAIATKSGEAWQQLLPAFVERCRTWSHKASCEYQKPGGHVPLSTSVEENPICSCGEGMNLGALSEVEAWADLRKYMTRIAISSLFAVPFLEPIVDKDSFRASDLASTSSSPTHAQNRCGHCQKEKPPSQLSSCGRCKNIRYCGSECQRADWKRHKKSCK